MDKLRICHNLKSTSLILMYSVGHKNDTQMKANNFFVIDFCLCNSHTTFQHGQFLYLNNFFLTQKKKTKVMAN